MSPSSLTRTVWLKVHFSHTQLAARKPAVGGVFPCGNNKRIIRHAASVAAWTCTSLTFTIMCIFGVSTPCTRGRCRGSHDDSSLTKSVPVSVPRHSTVDGTLEHTNVPCPAVQRNHPRSRQIREHVLTRLDRPSLCCPQDWHPQALLHRTIPEHLNNLPVTFIPF